MHLLDQSGVTGGGLDSYNVYVLFVNMNNMWTERFGNLRLFCFKSVVNFTLFCIFFQAAMCEVPASRLQIASLHNVGDEVEFSCNSGQIVVKCLTGGHWNNTIPSLCRRGMWIFYCNLQVMIIE